jgi:hypothetical protein
VRDLPRRASIERHDPDLHGFLVRRHVHRLHLEGHPLSVGRDLRIGDPLQFQQGVDVERLPLRERRGAQSEQEQ